MLRNCINLIAYLIEEMEKPPALPLRAAFAKYADFGSVTAEEVQEMLDILGDSANEELAADGAVSCGQSANAFCYIFAKSNVLKNQCRSLAELKRVVNTIGQRIIRITLGGGHTYVIEQTDLDQDGETAMGNLYQSNIAVLGNPVVGITLRSYLAEQGNPLELASHLDDLALLSGPAVAPAKKLAVYKRLFTTNAFFGLHGAKEVTTAHIVKADRNISFTEARYQDFDPGDAAKEVGSIFRAAGDMKGYGKVAYIAKNGGLPG